MSPNWGSAVGRLPIQTGEEISLSRQLSVAKLSIGKMLAWGYIPLVGVGM